MANLLESFVGGFNTSINLNYWPQMNTDERGFPDWLTEHVLGAVFEVSNTLGAGYLEKVYERALLHESQTSRNPSGRPGLLPRPL